MAAVNSRIDASPFSAKRNAPAGASVSASPEEQADPTAAIAALEI
jgi:hypothetical protein